MRRWVVMALVLAGCATATPPYASVVNNPAAHAPNMAYEAPHDVALPLYRTGDTTPFVLDTGVTILLPHCPDECPPVAPTPIIVENY